MYTNRIEELHQLDPRYCNSSGKSLPARLTGDKPFDEQRSMLLEEHDDNEDEFPMI
jgi:hypothetical protein